MTLLKLVRLLRRVRVYRASVGAEAQRRRLIRSIVQAEERRRQGSQA